MGAISWFGARHAVIDVAWRISRTGKAPVLFNAGYNVRQFAGDNAPPDWRIWAVTVYEEAAVLPINLVK